MKEELEKIRETHTNPVFSAPRGGREVIGEPVDHVGEHVAADKRAGERAGERTNGRASKKKKEKQTNRDKKIKIKP